MLIAIQVTTHIPLIHFMSLAQFMFLHLVRGPAFTWRPFSLLGSENNLTLASKANKIKATSLASFSMFVIRHISPFISCEMHLFMMIVRYTLPYTLILALYNVDAFLMQFRSIVYEKRSSMLYSNEQIEQDSSALDPDIARQFKVVICASDACNKKSRNSFGLDEYALFAGILERRDENHRHLPLRVEEGTCMGNCKFGPCIGVEHEDYEGYVGLDGMKMDEFQDRVFKTIVTDADLDRVWQSVENGIRSMMEEDSESDGDE